jgi:uncharacterized coiled-coil protein SlyX
VDSRVIELESRVAYFEKLIGEINLVVFRQQEEIDGLRESLKLFQEKFSSAGSLVGDSSEETPPPHY